MKSLKFISNKKKRKFIFNWPIKIILITFSLSIFFSITSESILKNCNIIIAVILIFVFFIIGMIFDMIGVASTACCLDEFCLLTDERKYIKIASYIVKHADKVSSFCCDIIGDMCGILSGSAGASIVLKL